MNFSRAVIAEVSTAGAEWLEQAFSLLQRLLAQLLQVCGFLGT